MKFNIITPFPDLIKSFSETSLMGRSSENDLMSIKTHNPRDFASGKRKNIDDYPYGGGCGMVLTVEPLQKCIEEILIGPGSPDVPEKSVKIVLTSPQGRPFDQVVAQEFSEAERIIIICGHYEGIDERIADTLCTDEVSLGDFVMTGGEIAAMAIIDTVSRLIPGVVGKEDSVHNDSFYSEKVFDHPHFTRPPEWQGYAVPEVITSGNHAKINEAREQWALSKTARIRPDLVSWKRVEKVFEDKKKIKRKKKRLKRLKLAMDKNGNELIRPLSDRLFLGLVHCPVLNKFNSVSTTSVTNFDIHDISRSARTFGVENYFLILPQKNQRDMVEKIRDFWLDPDNKIPHKKRLDALQRIRVSPNLGSVSAEIQERTGKAPVIVITSARVSENIDMLDYIELAKLQKETDSPILILLGTGYGLAPEIIEQAHLSLPPIKGYDEWNHLSVRAAAAIILSKVNEAFKANE